MKGFEERSDTSLGGTAAAEKHQSTSNTLENSITHPTCAAGGRKLSSPWPFNTLHVSSGWGDSQRVIS